MINLDFDNRFAALPGDFYTKMPAEGFSAAPFLIHANAQAAQLIGLDPASFNDPDFPQVFSGNKIPPQAEPLAMVYAGHQFGSYVPQLGDGRALLIGQVRNARGELWDVQLKGAGLTPYSRFGDGRAVLRSCVREYLCGEALHGLGIPTTRALCIIGTGQSVERETFEPGAILTRLSQSHIRFGHFEYFYYIDRPDAVRQLADHVIRQHDRDLSEATDRYAAWFGRVVERTARLMAQWQAAGFAHGVMNTDNMSIIGLTIDYGPFGFLEEFDPNFICNHSDVSGRYAFSQQPAIALWNLYALASALQPLFPIDQAQPHLARFGPVFMEHYQGLMRRKLGFTTGQAGEDHLVQALMTLMHRHRSDYTLTFRTLPAGQEDEHWLALFHGDAEAASWLAQWRELLGPERNGLAQNLRAANPKYVLRNWVAETAIRAAQDRQDYGVISQVLKILQTPFDEHPEAEKFAAPPPLEMRDLCVSCSS